MRCQPPKDISQLTSLGEIVRHYRLYHTPELDSFVDSFAKLPSLQDAVRLAGLGLQADGRKRRHAYHVKNEPLRRFAEVLGTLPLGDCGDFHVLFLAVQSAAVGIRGIGPVTVYDTALCIGARRGLMPERVYLHAGTMAGARALGLRPKGDVLEVKDLPAEFRKLAAHHLENLLCIYKKAIARVCSEQSP